MHLPYMALWFWLCNLSDFRDSDPLRNKGQGTYLERRQKYCSVLSLWILYMFIWLQGVSLEAMELLFSQSFLKNLKQSLG